MKLVSLNIEMKKHYDTVFPFIEREDPDIMCLQEAPEEVNTMLQRRGYATAFIPTYMRNFSADDIYPEGPLLASKHGLENVSKEYCFKPSEELQVSDDNNKRDTYAMGFVIGESNGFNIASTHFTWTPRGEEPNQDQQEDLPKLLSMLGKQPPHILCGDMNIPRHHNFLYENFLDQYSDNIPEEYKSSLDKNIHQAGNDPKRAHLFTDFMVDYIFTQPPYRAENVRLEFGISDHAAVIADIYKD